MSLIEWSDKYRIGIKTIDAQHKQLIELINELNVAMATGESTNVLSDILSGLTQYTRIHFAYEEKLLEIHGYPQTVEHQQEHHKMISQVEQFNQQFMLDPTSAISLELMQYLTNWLTNHILVTDKEYVEFLVDKGCE